MARATIEECAGLLSAAIVTLTLADGLIHLSLAFILYHGRLFADAFSTLFVFNFLGSLALIAAFLLSPRFAPGDRRAIDLLIMAYAALAFRGVVHGREAKSIWPWLPIEDHRGRARHRTLLAHPDIGRNRLVCQDRNTGVRTG